MTGPLFLVGFMGCGKSAAGRRVAHRLEVPFHDSDRLVEEADGRSVERIFREAGEPYFREAEAGVMRRLCSGGPAVVAAGGGAFLAHASRRAMIQAGCTVWLDTPFEMIRTRLAGDRQRPLWDPEDLEGMRRLYEIRKPAYALARHRVDGSDREAAAGKVAGLIR